MDRVGQRTAKMSSAPPLSRSFSFFKGSEPARPNPLPPRSAGFFFSASKEDDPEMVPGEGVFFGAGGAGLTRVCDSAREMRIALASSSSCGSRSRCCCLLRGGQED